jgi:peptidoglycan hydrolase-like protein with peptidoglycan-binding domain
MADPTLRLHDRAPDVARAQEFLNRAGAILDPDGDIGGGTVRAVREFRLANGLPDNGLIDSPMWDLLRALSEPSPDIPTKTVAFIAREEVAGRDYYDSSCARPAWPGGDSGVTIGVGYDLGYQTAFEDDWSDQLPAADIARLKKWVGVTGAAAQAGPAALKDIVIPWAASWDGYIRRTLPQEIGKTRTAFVPGPTAPPLPPLCLGVLVSVVYNRGTAMTDNSADDRRREMRTIRDAVASGDYRRIPQALLDMRRLWPPGNGLIGRREREAALFQEGLAVG